MVHHHGVHDEVSVAILVLSLGICYNVLHRCRGCGVRMAMLPTHPDDVDEVADKVLYKKDESAVSVKTQVSKCCHTNLVSIKHMEEQHTLTPKSMTYPNASSANDIAGIAPRVSRVDISLGDGKDAIGSREGKWGNQKQVISHTDG